MTCLVELRISMRYYGPPDVRAKEIQAEAHPVTYYYIKLCFGFFTQRNVTLFQFFSETSEHIPLYSIKSQKAICL